MNSLIDFWQHIPEKLSPVLVSFGQFQIRWYSLSYLLALVIIYFLFMHRFKKKEHGDLNINKKDVEDVFLYIILGIIIGSRLGYILFYGFDFFLTNPLQTLLPFRKIAGEWKFTGISGMSYHGGAIAIPLFMIIYVKKRGLSYWRTMDFYVPCVPLGYGFGRLGNFMNSELYGRVTDAPWGMYFLDGNRKVLSELRHPSQIYEFIGEGILCFAVLWILRNKRFFPVGSLGPLYLITYGIARFVVEFFREPDDIFKTGENSIGTVLSFMTMGQTLSSLMILVGVSFIVYLKLTEKQRNLKHNLD